MATISAHGIQVRLPDGVEGRIFRRTRVGEEVPRPVAQFASFPIPPQTADFGAGAITSMTQDDIFVVLFEYGPESVGRALFSREGMPRTLAPEHFSLYTLRRGLGGHSGTQWFFTENGRPFTLYAVLGSHARRSALVPRVNDILQQVQVGTAR